jgi:hypothetical protein
MATSKKGTSSKKDGGGKGKGKKMSAKKAKAKEEEEAAAQLRLQELKFVRMNYANQCKKFISEPLPAIVKRLDKAIQGAEEADKVCHIEMYMSLYLAITGFEL